MFFLRLDKLNSFTRMEGMRRMRILLFVVSWTTENVKHTNFSESWISKLYDSQSSLSLSRSIFFYLSFSCLCAMSHHNHNTNNTANKLICVTINLYNFVICVIWWVWPLLITSNSHAYIQTTLTRCTWHKPFALLFFSGTFISQFIRLIERNGMWFNRMFYESVDILLFGYGKWTYDLIFHNLKR